MEITKRLNLATMSIVIQKSENSNPASYKHWN